MKLINNKNPIILKIKKLGINGEGIGYYRRTIVFVPGALPSELVIINIINVKKNYILGKLIKILKQSHFRVVPVDHYDVGGIELEHLEYDQQLKFKRNLVVQSLLKFKPKGYKFFHIHNTIGMNYPYEYRNKAQFQLGKNLKGEVIAGLYKPNSHSLVNLPIFKTQTNLTMQVMNYIVYILNHINASIYNEKENSGVLKTIVIRQSIAFNQLQITFITNSKIFPQKNKLIRYLTNKFSEIVSISQNINPGRTSLIWGSKTINLFGNDYIIERLKNITFKLSPRAFFQLNSTQTVVLYDEIKKALNLNDDDTLIDAYCGVGTIGIYVGQNIKEVRGMDIIPEAIHDAQLNASISNIKRFNYIVGSAEKCFYKWNNENFHATALVVDPPRSGLDLQFIKLIIKYGPLKFVYVSCNPSTLARDLKYLVKYYDVDYMQPIDMFPQTPKCEVVVKMKRKV